MADQGMKRRDVLTSLAAGVAGAIAAPGAAAGAVGRAQESQARQPAASGPEQTRPRLLDDHRLSVLAGLAERILPGSRAAGVADILDRVLAVESAQAQRRFLNAIGAFEREARTRHNTGWLEVTADQQAEILRAASTLAPSRPPTPPWTRGQPVERRSPSPAPPTPPANMRDHFDHLKDWIQRAYFTTAAGMTELGFTGRMAFPGFPGCGHAGNEHGG